jgi:hypothetical protein
LTQKSNDQESPKVSFVVSQLQPNQALEGKPYKIYTITLFIIFLSIIELAIYLKNGLVIELPQSILPQIILLIFLRVLVIKFTTIIQPRYKLISLLRVSRLSVAIGLIFGLVSGLFYRYIFMTKYLIIPTPIYALISLAIFGRIQWVWFYFLILPFLFLIALLSKSHSLTHLGYSLTHYFFGNTEQTWYVAIISGLIFGQVIQKNQIIKNYDASAIDSAEKATHSNQAIRKSLINAIIIGITTTIIIGLVKDFSQGIAIGLIFWLLSGGVACIQHITLRLILYYNGDIPWDYTNFLDYATDKLLLQRIGGSYKFIHRLLQEHLVNMSFEGEKSQ